MVFNRIRDYGGLVMFSHSLFSLPFGVLSMFWASGGLPSPRVMVWTVAALFFARLGANGFNRIADRFIDGKNPRTAGRHLPTGKVKLEEAWGLCLICLAGLCLSAFMLNLTCLLLLPFAVGLLVFYSYSKRFTWLCHFILGAACACAPVGAWIAVTGTIAWPPLLLGAGVCAYVGGFDILYGTQDIEFDRREKLKSIPACLGLKAALWISAFSHMGASAFFASLFLLGNVGLLYGLGVIVCSVCLLIEHYNVAPGNEKRMVFAAYSMNQIISAGFFLFAMADFFWRIR